MTVARCACGCGRIPGQDRRYVHGHNRRQPRRWTVEDRGHDTPCWVWQGARTGGGYGAIRVGTRTLPAHRVILEEDRALRGLGPVDTPHIDHLCRVTACVNPSHLEPVTVATNTRRGNSATLTTNEALDIRRRRQAGERGVDLAREYGVSQQTVCDILKGRKWTADLETAAG